MTKVEAMIKLFLAPQWPLALTERQYKWFLPDTLNIRSGPLSGPLPVPVLQNPTQHLRREILKHTKSDKGHF